MSGDVARAKRLFLAAVELDESEQGEFLDAQCGDDAALRRLVERMIAADRTAANVLDQALETPAANIPERNGTGRATVIGDYTITGRLGAGGMGIVYEAVQSEPRRRVALKILAGTPGMEALRRFRREINILGQLNHRHIARVFEAGSHDDGLGGRPYFAMELVEGARPIDQYVQEQGLGTPRRLELFLEVCDAVAHAHALGIIHRDLKPSNILVDAAGALKIIDFGVAGVAADADLSVVSAATTPGQLIGTLRYISPESFAAREANEPPAPGVRGDVYALGVVLYELLTGRSPYPVDTVSPYELPRLIRESEPTRLSQYDATLRGDLETIAFKAMEKEPSRRYASVEALADDVRRHLAGEPIEARRGQRWYRLRRKLRRHRRVVSIVTLIALTVGLCATVVLAMYERSEQSLNLSQNRVEMLRRGALTDVPSLASFTDDFEDGELDPRFLPAGREEWVVEEGGRLILATPPGEYPALFHDLDPAQHLLRGDFDISVDFELIDFPVPQHGAHQAMLAVTDPVTNAFIAAVRRYNEVNPGPDVPSPETYSAGFSAEDHVFVPTTDRSGRMRLRRRGSVVGAYYFDRDWVLIVEEKVTDQPVILRFVTHSYFNQEGTVVAFDKLSVETVFPGRRTCLGSLVDDFDGAHVDARYSAQSSYGYPREQGGKLRIVKENGHAGEYGVKLDAARYVLCGDFAVDVGFELTDFPTPPSGEHWTALRVRDADSGALVASVERCATGQADGARALFRGRFAGTAATPTRPATERSGALRIERQGGHLVLSGADGTEPVRLGRAAMPAGDLYYEVMSGSSDTTLRHEIDLTHIVVTTGAARESAAP